MRKARKTILELILANHPQDCLHCEKNGKCELQTLAAEYNIRGNIFDPVWKPVPKEMSNPALVRDMGIDSYQNVEDIQAQLDLRCKSVAVIPYGGYVLPQNGEVFWRLNGEFGAPQSRPRRFPQGT